MIEMDGDEEDDPNHHHLIIDYLSVLDVQASSKFLNTQGDTRGIPLFFVSRLGSQYLFLGFVL
jgi:hypothetical protein